MIEGDTEKEQFGQKCFSVFRNGVNLYFFTDNANKGAADVYKDKSLPIYV